MSETQRNIIQKQQTALINNSNLTPVRKMVPDRFKLKRKLGQGTFSKWLMYLVINRCLFIKMGIRRESGN